MQMRARCLITYSTPRSKHITADVKTNSSAVTFEKSSAALSSKLFERAATKILHFGKRIDARASATQRQ
jgi:hypothetical protein